MDEKKIIELGKKIFVNRGRRSEVSGALLGDKYNHAYICHILPCKNYPKLRLSTKNILLLTISEHNLWKHSRRHIMFRKEWYWVLQLANLLRENYKK